MTYTHSVDLTLCSLQSYPGPLSCKVNAIMAITPPFCLRQAGSNRADAFAFHTISRTNWRNWEVSVDNPREKDGKTTSRVTWPSLKNSLELATYSVRRLVLFLLVVRVLLSMWYSPL